MPMLAIAPPFQGSAWMFRALPVLERRFPGFLVSIIGPQESAGLLDWRRARYSLYSTLDPDNRYLPTRESRYEEGLIERLGRPGVVSSAVRQFIQGRQSGNVLAQIAGWLLCARRHRPAFLRRHDLLDAFARWRGANISLLSIPDISLLEYLWEADEFKYINLSAPVFSASWRLLAHIPSSAWLGRKSASIRSAGAWPTLRTLAVSGFRGRQVSTEASNPKMRTSMAVWQRLLKPSFVWCSAFRRRSAKAT